MNWVIRGNGRKGKEGDTVRNPYLSIHHFQSDSGETFPMMKIWEIANRNLKEIIYTLPEEAKTYDVVLQIIKEMQKQLNGTSIKVFGEV